MSTADDKADREWSKLADLEEGERRATMLERYAELAALPEEERVTRMLAMAYAEYDLPYDELRDFTISRLNSWLTLDAEVAQRVSNSYDVVMHKVPAEQAMLRVGLVQTLARAFSTEERARLVDLNPGVFGPDDPVVLTSRSQRRQSAMSSAAHPTRPKRSWWQIWKR
jgi:hypothetical protein